MRTILDVRPITKPQASSDVVSIPGEKFSYRLSRIVCLGFSDGIDSVTPVLRVYDAGGNLAGYYVQDIIDVAGNFVFSFSPCYLQNAAFASIPQMGTPIVPDALVSYGCPIPDDLVIELGMHLELEMVGMSSAGSGGADTWDAISMTRFITVP